MTRLITAAAVCAIALTAFADDDFDRTLRVGPQPDLYISTGSGSIRVNPGTDGAIHIAAHVHADWSRGGDVQARIARITANPPIQQSGNSIHVGEPADRSLYNGIAIDYEITAPTAVALNLRSGAGEVEVNHVGRFLAAVSGSGSVRAHGVHGTVTLESGSGDIEVQEEAPGDVKAKTGSGSIRINGFSGGLNLRTGSGDLEANGRLTAAARLSSGSGSVRMNLQPDARFNLEASTGSGSIRVHFPNAPQQTDDSRHQISGAVNGGGPLLEAHSGSGDIEINATNRSN